MVRSKQSVQQYRKVSVKVQFMTEDSQVFLVQVPSACGITAVKLLLQLGHIAVLLLLIHPTTYCIDSSC